MNRRELLKYGAALPLAPAALSGTAVAQMAFPTRNITMIVPFPAGGQADLAARPVALALERILGKPVIVDNRAAAAGGSIGNAQAARAEPDGYTLLMTLSSLAVLPEADRLFDRPVAYEFAIAPIARARRSHIACGAGVCAVEDAAGVRRRRQRRPGQIPFVVRSLRHAPRGDGNVRGERRNQIAARAVRGAGPALTALLSGTVAGGRRRARWAARR
jgi:tripartite-type tricarboxylate transporter receptor subunit TctC